MYGEISEVVIFSPNRGRIAEGPCRKYTVEHGVGHDSRPRRPFSPMEITSASCGVSGWSGGCCGKYHPLRLSWRSAEGSVDGGLVPVKVRTPSEGLPHACRGFCSRGRFEELAT